MIKTDADAPPDTGTISVAYTVPGYISPLKTLEDLASENLKATRPRPIDPGVYFDLLKIRRYIEEDIARGGCDRAPAVAIE
jgi:hypothetical protein